MITIDVADVLVEVDLGIDVLAVLTGHTGTEDVSIVDADAGDVGGEVEVGHCGR